jgi:hypothetical protein
MSAAHVWTCGRCGTRVVAPVGAILTTFQAHAEQCPARARPRVRPPAVRPLAPSPAPRAAAPTRRRR